MELKKILLHKCKGLVKGSDLHNVEIDFTDINPTVIGLFGKSGTGKSTLLRNLNPYRKDFNNDFYEGGYRHLEFEFKDNSYFSKISHKDAYLFKNQRLLNESGKVSTYDEVLEEELGDEKTFFKLLYAGKRFSNILSLTKGEKKELLIDYLLDYLKDYEVYETKLKNELTNKLIELQEYELSVEDYDLEFEKHKDYLKQSWVEKSNYEDLEDKIEDINNYQKLYLAREKEIEDWKRQHEELVKGKKELNQQRDGFEHDLKVKDKKLVEVKERYSELKDKLEDIKGIGVKNIEKDEERVLQLRKDFENIVDKSNSLSLDIHKSGMNIERIEKNFKDKNEAIENLKLPCDSKLQLKCPLTKFRDVEKLIQEEKQLLEEYKIELEKEKKNKESLTQELKNTIKEKKEIEELRNRLEESIDKHYKTEKLRAQEPLLQEYKKQGKDLQEDVKILKEKIEKIDDKIEKINEDEYILEQEDHGNIYRDRTNDLKLLQDDLNKSDANLKFLELQVFEGNERIQKLQIYKDGIKQKQKDVLEYNLLIKFFGKEGGQIFDIEHAGLEISRVANQLLENYKDKKIEVRFDTLKENKKGETKEIFDISCSINNDEWETYLSDGEEVLVSNAIREAMCYLRQQKDFKTVFVDELDGSIDEENKIGFIKLLQEGNKLNNRQFTFLISHSGDIKGYLEKSITFKNNNLILNL